jgi:WD40 repeat protein
VRGKSKSISLASTLLILTVMTFSICCAQGIQATPPSTHPQMLIPPPPSTPYWTYKTGASVRTVAISTDGKMVVAGSNDKYIYVFGRSSNTTLWTYKTDNVIRSVAVSDNGSTIVAGSWDDKVYAFDRSSNTTLWTYKTGAYLDFVAISADGNTIVAGSEDHSIYVFGRSSNTTLWTYKTGDWVGGVAVSADGNTIVAGSEDDSFYVFGRSSNTTLWTYKTSYRVYGAAVSSDGNTIVAGDAGGANTHIYVFGRSSNTTLWTYKTASDVYGVTVSRDGTTIAAGSWDRYLRVFGRSSNTTLIEYNTGQRINRATAISSDGSTIACGDDDWIDANSQVFLFSKTAGLLWDYTTGTGIGGAPQESASAAAISSDGSLSAYGGNDGTVFVFQYDMVPPVLGSPSVSPSSPVGGQNVNVSVSATDNVGVSTVTVYYRDASAGSWSSAVMSPAGSVYTARIGPFASGVTIYYYVTAVDTSGNIVNSPVDAPVGYHTFAVGSAPGIQWTSVLIGAALGAVIAIVVCFVLLRGKKGGR